MKSKSTRSTLASLAASTLLLAILANAGCATGPDGKRRGELPPPPEPDRELSILAERAGTLSGVTERTRLVIQPGEEAPELPGIPLDTLRDVGDEQPMIIVWALGEKPSGGFGVDIAEVLLFDQTLVVRGRMLAPGPDEIVTEALTYPYHAVAVPAVEFEDVVWHAVRPQRKLYEPTPAGGR